MKYAELTDGTYINLAQIVGFSWSNDTLVIYDATECPFKFSDPEKIDYNKMKVASCN